MYWVIIVVAVIVGLFVLDQLLLFLERHDIIYWRKREPISGSAGANAFNAFTGVFDPGRERAQEMVREQDLGEDLGNADPDDPTRMIVRLPPKQQPEDSADPQPDS